MSEYELSEMTEIIDNASTLTPWKNEPLRVCRICGLKAYTKADLNLFTKNETSLHGRMLCCKNCTRKNALKYYQKHKEWRRERSLKYYHKNREKRMAYSLKYNQEHKEELIKKRKKYNQERKAERKEYDFLYRPPSGYLKGDGCCMWPDCHNINPFVLQNHHLWKENDLDFTMTFCANHHEYFTRGRSAFLTFDFIEEEQLK